MLLKRIYIISFIALVLCTGCGKFKSKDDKTITIQQPQNADPNGPQSVDEEFRKLKEFYELYANEHGISKQELLNITERYKEKLKALANGKEVRPEEIVDLIFNLSGNTTENDQNANNIWPRKLIKSAAKYVPLLQWTENGKSFDRTDLAKQLVKEFSDASQESINGLTDTLFLFDNAIVGGNQDHRLNQNEVATTGVILSVMSSVEYPTAQYTTNHFLRFALSILQRKMKQQIFLRYQDLDLEKLSKRTLNLEWARLAIKLFFADSYIRKINPKGILSIESELQALAEFLGIEKMNFKSLALIYDSYPLGGNKDGNLNPLELFDLISDLDFSKAYYDFHKNNLVNLIRDHSSIAFQGLTEIFSHAENDLYWNQLLPLESRKYGGNGNGKLDIVELTIIFAYLRTLDTSYFLFDQDHDQKISKEEFLSAFKLIGFDGSKIVDAFFANIGLDSSYSQIFSELQLLFNTPTKVEPLSPTDFFDRMKKVMPRLTLQ